MTSDEQMHPVAKVIITLVGLMGVWSCVSGDAYRPALSSYGSSQQVVSPPDGASIAIAVQK